jgi:glycosyltransferase involved in cell wall biosynthesis
LKNNKLRLLIAGDKTRFIHLKQLIAELGKIGIESKLIYDLEFIDKFFEMNIKKKIDRNKNFREILNEFNPDAVLLDRISKIGKKVIEQNIPLLILLRGNLWEESSWAKKTIYKSRIKKLALAKNERFIDFCLKKSSIILPISKYLENEVKKRYPEKNVELFPADGRVPEEWYSITGQKLKHPCVGLLQGLNIWGKSKEILTLKNVLKKLPQVTFYLAGDGIYRDQIIPELKNFKNFVWLGNLKYPNEVKEFFTEIDVYVLLSGLEGLGQTIIEASLMKKPIIATNVGGIKDLIQDNKTGFLIQSGDESELIKKILFLLENNLKAEIMGENACLYIKKNFSWAKIASDFSRIITKHSDLFITKKRNNNL